MDEKVAERELRERQDARPGVAKVCKYYTEEEEDLVF